MVRTFTEGAGKSTSTGTNEAPLRDMKLFFIFVIYIVLRLELQLKSLLGVKYIFQLCAQLTTTVHCVLNCC